jgi:CheY-like chemotaxis protein
MGSTPGNITHPPIILVVEDDESNREMYATFLEIAGYWVLGASSGAEGLVTARRYHPHVVVTDVSMPGMDGWSLAKALRANERTEDIGIIAVSGWRKDDVLARAAEDAQVDVVLTKPCLPDDLLREIRKLLARGRLARIRATEQLAKAHWLRERSDRLLRRSSKHHKRGS